jgi:hypothetical protein
MKKIGIILSLCLMALIGNVKAQDATLDETLEFLTLKSYNYCTSSKDGRIHYDYREKKFIYNKIENRIYFVVYSEGLEKEGLIVARTKKRYYIDLNSNIVMMLHNGDVKFISGVKFDSDFYNLDHPERDAKTYNNDDPNYTIIYDDGNGTRAFKAFKHLFKLLNKEITIKESVENKF